MDKKTIIGGLSSIVLSLASGCVVEVAENREAKMPDFCKNNEIINAGYSASFTTLGALKTSYDYLSCKGSDGSIVIFKLSEGSDQWYSTVIKK